MVVSTHAGTCVVESDGSVLGAIAGKAIVGVGSTAGQTGSRTRVAYLRGVGIIVSALADAGEVGHCSKSCATARCAISTIRAG